MSAAVSNPHAVLDAAKHRLVRRVVLEDSEASAALFRIASRGRQTWGLADWNNLLAELDACDLTVGAWIEQHNSIDWTQ
jgi:hypothetical protein